VDETTIAVAVAADRTVQREREALPHYLAGAYRDPYAAKARLDEMVKRQGWTSTAARIAPDATQLAELRGKVGLFTGSKAKAERAMAERAANAVAPSLERIGATEAQAARTYRENVENQHKADATPIPKPTARAEAVMATLTAAPDEKARAELWRGIAADQTIGPELRRFSAAVQQRFCDDTVRAMLRNRGGLVEAASVPREHQAAFATVSRTVHTLKTGEHAGARQADAARLAQRQALGYRRGLKP
jgi:BID domain of Bartonella effector protein (Bep)